MPYLETEGREGGGGGDLEVIKRPTAGWAVRPRQGIYPDPRLTKLSRRGLTSTRYSVPSAIFPLPSWILTPEPNPYAAVNLSLHDSPVSGRT